MDKVARLSSKNFAFVSIFSESREKILKKKLYKVRHTPYGYRV